jgi:signal transduction histidine kinase
MPTLRTMEFAHQMRDLLTVVVGSLEQLRQQPLDEHGRHQLARAEVAVERATELLNRYSPLSPPGQQDGHNAEEPQ